MSTDTPIYRVVFRSLNEVYEVYVRNFYQSDIHGFIELEDYLFGERSQVVVDPTEEKLKGELSGVMRSFIPFHAIVRIDEVKQQGTARISDIGKDGKVLPFPNIGPPSNSSN